MFELKTNYTHTNTDIIHVRLEITKENSGVKVERTTSGALGFVHRHNEARQEEQGSSNKEVIIPELSNDGQKAV